MLPDPVLEMAPPVPDDPNEMLLLKVASRSKNSIPCEEGTGQRSDSAQQTHPQCFTSFQYVCVTR